LAVQGEYGILVLTEASTTVLSGGRTVMLRKEAPRRSKAAKRAVAADLPGEALPLFERLRNWRAETAREQGVPAYIVFGDATLRGIAITRPSALAELGAISGVGEKKLEQYGDAILAVVAAE
ncbi:MAG: HRDC domain-containing protein, partial [Rhodoglobus sp.]